MKMYIHKCFRSPWSAYCSATVLQGF